MTDILERLDNHQIPVSEFYIMRDARDEIIRLRAELAAMQAVVDAVRAGNLEIAAGCSCFECSLSAALEKYDAIQ